MPLASSATRIAMRSSSVAPSRGTTTTTTHKSSSPPSPHTAVGLDILAELRHLRDSIQTTTSSSSTSSENAATGHHVATKQQLKSTSRGRSGSATVSSRRLNGIAEGGIGSKGSMSGSGSGGYAQQVLPNQQQQQHHNRTAFGSHQTQSNDPFNHNRIKSKSSSSTTSMDASGSGDTRSGGGHPPLAPSETAVAAGDGLLSANVGVQPDVAAVKRELHRVTESYGALVREYRSAKIIWEAEDSKKSDEISRLSAGLSGADRSRRDVYEALKTAKESRLEAQREREACALYKEKAESEKKLRDSAERRATDSAEQLKTLHSRVKELSSLNEELEISRARESAAIKRVRDSDERIRALLKDREEMAAELGTLKNLHKEGAENFAKAKTFASMRESLEYEAKDAQDRLASMAIRLAEVEENAAKVVPLTEERDDARRHVDHLESVQSELLTAVQLQAADLSKMKEEVESHSGDAKRISRLEKALEAYRNVEKLFTQKTGQGFFGPAGLAAAAATSPIEGDGDHGATTAFAGGALASELVGEYIDRLRSSISAEVKSELSASISSERQKAAGSVLEAEMRMLEHQKAADAACSAREVLEAWKRRALAVEETVSSIISAPKLARSSSSSSSSATSGLESSSDANDTNTNTGHDPLDPDIASDPLYTSEWDKLPSFVAVLPRLASAVGRLRSDIGAAIRRRRLAEIEAQDLREELACVRGDDVAAVALHRVASNDVRNALKRASDERSNLRAEISSLTAQLSAANIRVSDLESKLVQAGSKLTSARQQRDEKEKDCISIRESLEIEKAACANAKAALATAEQRLHDAKETNERALKMLAARDAEITRMKVYGENHHGVAAHQGDTIEGGSNSSRQAIKPPPAPSLYGSVSVPNYNPSSVFDACAAAKASANEAAAQQLEKEKEKEREEQAKIDRREKERKSLAKAARAKAEAAAVAAAAQASAAEAEERRRYAEAEAAAAAAVTAAEEARAVEAKRAAKEARRRMREAEAAAAEADALRRRELEAVTEQIRVMEARRNEEKKDTERRAAAIARQATEAAERLAAMQQHQQQQHQQQQQSTNNQTTSAMLLMQQAAINSALLRRGSRDSALLELSLRRRDSESSSTRGDIRKPSSSSSRYDDAGRNRTSRSHRHHRGREEDAPLSSPSDGGDSIRQQEHRHDHDRDHDLKKKKHSSLSSREKTETKLEDAISSSSAAADAERSTRGGGGGGAGTKRPTSSTLSSLPERSVEPSSLVKHPQAQQSSHSSRSNTTPAATFSSSSSSGGAAAGAASSTSKTVKSLAPPPHSKSLSMNNPKGAVETRPTATADTSFSISTPSGGEEEEEDRNDTDHYYTQHPTHLESVPEWRSAVSPTPREKPPANRNSTQTRMTGKAVIVTRPSVVTAIVDNDATVENEASSADTTSIFAGITGIYSSSSDIVSAAVASKGNGDREGEGRGEGRGRQVRRESISGLLSAQELADTHFKTTLRSREGSVASSQASSRASSRSRSGSVGDFSRSYYHKRR